MAEAGGGAVLDERVMRANAAAFERLTLAEPVLVDVRPAGEVVPGMTSHTILTSGPAMPWERYTGGQREAIIGGALFEGLAGDRDEAEAKLAGGEIVLGACHDHACVGSVAGIYTASMPVFVVRTEPYGNHSYCNFYEGDHPRRLNYGCYDEGVRERLLFAQDVVAPVLGDAVRRAGGVALRPLMARALHMGDELHSRNTAATLLFGAALLPTLLEMAADGVPGVHDAASALAGADYFFLRLSMAAAKGIADAAHGIEHSSVVTALAVSCQGFAIRVSGTGSQWFTGPHARIQGRFFEGFDESDVQWMGGESCITETVGLGGFAQAAAFPLQRYQGGDPDAMVRANTAMYDITVGESPTFRIPYLSYRGTPTGIDVWKVLATGVTPVIDAGIPGRDGGQIGAGLVTVPIECFEAAGAALADQLG